MLFPKRKTHMTATQVISVCFNILDLYNPKGDEIKTKTKLWLSLCNFKQLRQNLLVKTVFFGIAQPNSVKDLLPSLSVLLLQDFLHSMTKKNVDNWGENNFFIVAIFFLWYYSIFFTVIAWNTDPKKKKKLAERSQVTIPLLIGDLSNCYE